MTFNFDEVIECIELSDMINFCIMKDLGITTDGSVKMVKHWIDKRNLLCLEVELGSLGSPLTEWICFKDKLLPFPKHGFIMSDQNVLYNISTL